MSEAGDLVSLQVSHQVPTDLPVGQGRIVGLLPELLRTAFAQISAAGGYQLGRRVGVDVLADAD